MCLTDKLNIMIHALPCYMISFLDHTINHTMGEQIIPFVVPLLMLTFPSSQRLMFASACSWTSH